MKIEEEANDCSVDKLQLDRNGIDEDMMHNVDEHDGDDRAIINNPRSVKVLVTSHTNGKIIDDEQVQTMPNKSSRVVTPTVDRRTDCEESGRGQRRSIYQPDAVPTMDGDGQKQSRNQSDMTTRDEEERQVQHEEDVHLPMKASSSIPTTPGCTKSYQSQDRHDEPSSGVKIVDGKDIERGVNNLLQGKSGCQTGGGAIRDCDLQDKSDRLVEVKDIGVIGEERTEADWPSASTYHIESGEMYAEDIDQHMEILPEVITPAIEIS